MSRELRARTVDSPVGELLLVGGEQALRGLYFPQHRPTPRLPSAMAIGEDGFLDATAAQLDEWFAGARERFDLPLSLDGTAFQRAVWTELLAIPYGSTTTYGELAAAVGRPGSARAVGHAVAHNPISIVVPCHRVVGKDGSLTGYAGGTHRKQALLAREGRITTLFPDTTA